ncbi:MAG: ATP-binding protein, partial [Candidatus Helarchaeales archaeon]
MALREYIQNAADAIDAAVRDKIIASDEGRIEIHVDGGSRTLTILDNGSGVVLKDIVDTLCSIGCSEKTRFQERGFRGIGRLGGIGYCDRLVFETRQIKSEPVASVIWDAAAIRKELAGGDVDQASL